MLATESTYSTLCFASGPHASWEGAEQYCFDQFQAGLCTARQWRRAVCLGAVPNPGLSWLSDLLGAENERAAAFGTCSVEVGFQSVSVDTDLVAVCCLEWMKYN